MVFGSLHETYPLKERSFFFFFEIHVCVLICSHCINSFAYACISVNLGSERKNESESCKDLESRRNMAEALVRMVAKARAI